MQQCSSTEVSPTSPVPAAVKVRLARRVLYAWGTYVHPEFACNAPVKRCSHCGVELRQKTPWFCAGDELYCSQTCRLPNMPFAQRSENRDKTSSRPAVNASPPPSRSSAAAAAAAAPLAICKGTVPDITGSPSFDVGHERSPGGRPKLVPALGSSPSPSEEFKSSHTSSANPLETVLESSHLEAPDPVAAPEAP